MKKYALSCLVLLLLAATSNAEVIFEDNFDSQPDWRPQPAVSNNASPAGGYIECNFYGQVCNPLPPVNWSFYRTTGLWWEPSYNSTIRISSQAGRGGAGKAFIVYNESNKGASGDGWGADGILTKIFDGSYPELYLRAWILYQPGWQATTTDDMMIKTLRILHNSKTGNVFLNGNNTGGTTAPYYMYLFKHSNKYGTRAMFDYRCEPHPSNFYCGYAYDHDRLFFAAQGATPTPTSTGEPADGKWHRYDLHVKMNTFTGTTPNADGVAEFWYDGVLLDTKTNVKWLADGADPSEQWNSIALGGNAYNLYSDPTNAAEQWYAIDDVVVSTTPIPADYVISSRATTGPKAPEPPKNLRGTVNYKQ